MPTFDDSHGGSAHHRQVTRMTIGCGGVVRLTFIAIRKAEAGCAIHCRHRIPPFARCLIGDRSVARTSGAEG